MVDEGRQGIGAFSRDALVLGKGLYEFLARHQAKNDDEARLLRASHMLAGELLRHVACDVDVQLSQLEQMSIEQLEQMSVDETLHLIDQAFNKPAAQEEKH